MDAALKWANDGVKHAKKIALLLCAAAVICASKTAGAVESAELKFKPAGGGNFIYCNNPEGVDDRALINGSSPRYIMNNENLAPGKYYIYLSHYNFVDKLGATDALSRDMELDVELTPTSGECEYTISNVGFEATETYARIPGGIPFVYEWGQLNCCAQAMNKSIVELDGDEYYPCSEDSKSYSVTDSDTRWLSEFIPNYSVVHYRQPVHIQALLEIKSGTMDVNVCAFRSNGTLRDRSEFNPDAAFGEMRYDRSVKGIADTLPQVIAELSYTIDDTTEDGDYLPVTMHNDYAPDGCERDEWFTNLNPLDDPWAKENADATGMLGFEYYDPTKLSYYGADVAEEKRDSVWHIDIHHTDTHGWENQPGAASENLYEPNYAITAETDASGYASNLGNYGVTYTYDLTINNAGTHDRYFTYVPTTDSDIIVFTEETGKELDYAISKGKTSESCSDVMSVVKLKAGETTSFSVNMVLPVNYNGGIKNAFIIRDEAADIDIPAIIDSAPTNEHMCPIDGEYLSAYADLLPDDTKAKFEGMEDCYEIMQYGDRFLVRYCNWDGSPYGYYGGWSLASDVYILSRDLEILGSVGFPSLPCKMSCITDGAYIQTVRDGIYIINDDLSAEKTQLSALPENGECDYSVTYIRDISDWSEDYISRAEGLGCMAYSAVGETYANKPITRGSFSHALYKLKSLKSDVPDGEKVFFLDTRRECVMRLAQWGVVTGYENDKFCAEREITREEAAVILARFLTLYGYIETDDTVYTDADLIQDWARDAVRIVSNYGIMRGVDDTHFDPKGTYTYEQCATVLTRLYDTIR